MEEEISHILTCKNRTKRMKAGVIPTMYCTVPEGDWCSEMNILLHTYTV